MSVGLGAMQKNIPEAATWEAGAFDTLRRDAYPRRYVPPHHQWHDVLLLQPHARVWVGINRNSPTHPGEAGGFRSSSATTRRAKGPTFDILSESTLPRRNYDDRDRK
jgi:hypothetical protein